MCRGYSWTSIWFRNIFIPPTFFGSLSPNSPPFREILQKPRTTENGFFQTQICRKSCCFGHRHFAKARFGFFQTQTFRKSQIRGFSDIDISQKLKSGFFRSRHFAKAVQGFLKTNFLFGNLLPTIFLVPKIFSSTKSVVVPRFRLLQAAKCRTASALLILTRQSLGPQILFPQNVSFENLLPTIFLVPKIFSSTKKFGATHFSG